MLFYFDLFNSGARRGTSGNAEKAPKFALLCVLQNEFSDDVFFFWVRWGRVTLGQSGVQMAIPFPLSFF